MSLQHALHCAPTASISKFHRFWSRGSRPVATYNKKHILHWQMLPKFSLRFIVPRLTMFIRTWWATPALAYNYILTPSFSFSHYYLQIDYGTHQISSWVVTAIPFVTLTPVLRGLRNRCASVPPHHTLTRLEGGVLNYRNILYNVRRANWEKDRIVTLWLHIIMQRVHLWDLGTDGRILLKFSFNKLDVDCVELTVLCVFSAMSVCVAQL